jgi:hypothetical protein
MSTTTPTTTLLIRVIDGDDYEHRDPGPHLLTLVYASSASFAFGTGTAFSRPYDVTSLRLTMPGGHVPLVLPVRIGASANPGTPILPRVTAFELLIHHSVDHLLVGLQALVLRGLLRLYPLDLTPVLDKERGIRLVELPDSPADGSNGFFELITRNLHMHGVLRTADGMSTHRFHDQRGQFVVQALEATVPPSCVRSVAQPHVDADHAVVRFAGCGHAQNLDWWRGGFVSGHDVVPLVGWRSWRIQALPASRANHPLGKPVIERALTDFIAALQSEDDVMRSTKKYVSTDLLMPSTVPATGWERSTMPEQSGFPKF